MSAAQSLLFFDAGRGDPPALLRDFAGAQGLDLVFDKSFLPKANKAILYTSPNVKDLTSEVIASLNAGAPASSGAAGAPATTSN